MDYTIKVNKSTNIEGNVPGGQMLTNEKAKAP